MKIAIINKSDSTGGAAVVSFRLMEALRRMGADASMVVCEKLSDSPHVYTAASPRKIRRAFLKERLAIFAANGFNRSTLFKIDTASDGLDLLAHPVVREADIICLNWVNQGMLSLSGIRRLAAAGKKIIWTMHDMWCFTGICHHAGECGLYRSVCSKCPLLKGALLPSLAERTMKRKMDLYRDLDIHFVAVSNWLADRGEASSLFGRRRPTVIPNAFPFENKDYISRKSDFNKVENREIRIVFGAARLDDTVKGLPILVEATRILARNFPEQAARLRLVTFGEAKDPASLEGFGIAVEHLGRVNGAKAVREIYESADIVVSTSHYETLPGTLVEGQVYGCIPVAFDSGGQGDIVEHLSTGFLARKSPRTAESAAAIAAGIVWAAQIASSPDKMEKMRRRMFESAYTRFNEERVAESYLRLFEK